VDAAGTNAGSTAVGVYGVGIPGTEEELGELLFGIAAGARAGGLDAERALRGALRRFQDRRGGAAGPAPAAL
jgi:XTP/dITP diphosphohydrolase